MCIRVQFADLESLRPWDAARQVITIPRCLEGIYALEAVRRVLHELSIPQDGFDARCWCGEPIEFLERNAQQQRSDEVIHLGA